MTYAEAKAEIDELDGKTDPPSIKRRNELMLALTGFGFKPPTGPGVHEHFIADVRTRK
jgi:hypothetical protein